MTAQHIYALALTIGFLILIVILARKGLFSWKTVRWCYECDGTGHGETEHDHCPYCKGKGYIE